MRPGPASADAATSAAGAGTVHAVPGARWDCAGARIGKRVR
jgi:hypothetical protein